MRRGTYFILIALASSVLILCAIYFICLFTGAPFGLELEILLTRPGSVFVIILLWLHLALYINDILVKFKIGHIGRWNVPAKEAEMFDEFGNNRITMSQKLKVLYPFVIVIMLAVLFLEIYRDWQ